MTLTAADVRATDFPAASRLRRGYDADAVDAFVERIARRLETGEGLSSNDVYHAPFAKAGIGGRGYSSTEVDAFLERVHVELLRIEDAWGHVTLADDRESGHDRDAPDVGDELDSSDLPADGEALAEIAIAPPDDSAIDATDPEATTNDGPTTVTR